jgi:FkbM family methyltransferase
MLLLSHWVQPGDAVIDIGANIGTHSVFFSRQVGPEGTVLAIEAQPEIYSLLLRNLALNDCLNVHGLNAAAGEAMGEIELPALDYGRDGNFGALSFRIEDVSRYLPANKDSANIQLPVLPLDALLDGRRLGDPQIKNCTLLKIDAEGMEREVLDGAVRVVEKFRPILYLENNNREASPALIEKIQSFDYRAYWHVISYYRPENFAKCAENVFSAPLELNVLCMPNEADTDSTGLPAVAESNQWLPEEIQQGRFSVDELLHLAESFGRDFSR